MMWFGVLGPLLVADGEMTVEVPAGRQRALLAALLLHAGHPVSADALAETVWDGMPPPGAAATLRSHVMRLRRALGTAAGARVVTRFPGYLVEAGAQEVDLLQFATLRRDGGAAVRDGAWEQAWALLGQALALWRGPALADIPSQVLHRDEVPGLEQQRLQAMEWRVDAGLQLGRHGELVAGLSELTAAHPLRERFHAQFMLALYRCGRQGEALAAYRAARDRLTSELGVDPGPELRQLHQRLLAADPDLAVATPAGGAGAAAGATGGAGPFPPVVPRQLPAALRYFAGRRAEIEALSRWLDQAAAAAGTVVISAIAGTAGVGKTALAVYWAHQVAERFPDGQLYVNLRGFGPSGQPATPEEVIRGFLDGFAVPAGRVPASLDAQTALYRSLTAARRMLVVLDNARDEQQVRPLLPANPGCLVVVTSRRQLTGLIATDGACPVTLDLLSQQDARELLTHRLGPERAAREPGAVAELTRLCARLPLALSVAAAHAAASPRLRLADLAAELGGERHRLDVLDDGDAVTSVRAVFSWSYERLSPAAARLFRYLGLHPGPDVTAAAAASLTGLPPGQVRDLIRELTRTHLLSEQAPGRFACHDLLRAYALEQACARDAGPERRAALTRLFDYYLAAAATAADALFPSEEHHGPPAPPSPPVPPVRTAAAGLDWLNAERASLVAVTVHAARHGWPRPAILLAAILYRYLDTGGHYRDAITIHGHARRAARQSGDRAAEATALISLGIVDWRQDRNQQAAGHYRQALALFREAGDQVGEAQALNNLGCIDWRQGRYQRAIRYLRQALALFREAGDQVGEAQALNNLGCIDARLGHCPQAVGHHQLALALFGETGHRTGEAQALSDLGWVDGRLARYRQAADRYRQALALFLAAGHERGEAEALNGLGASLTGAGLPGQARDQHQRALILARRIGARYQQARAHDGLGDACHATGDPGQAHRHWRRAFAVFADLGVPEADEVSAKLLPLASSAALRDH
jgi:DNA-binding SARP family transcriptional activator/tetratricopeptide (TPR) repeat protein